MKYVIFVIIHTNIIVDNNNLIKLRIIYLSYL